MCGPSRASTCGAMRVTSSRASRTRTESAFEDPAPVRQLPVHPRRHPVHAGAGGLAAAADRGPWACCWAGCCTCWSAPRRRVVQTNLRLCFPDRPEAERRRLARQTFVYFAQAWLDRSWLWHGHPAWVRRRLQADGRAWHELAGNAADGDVCAAFRRARCRLDGAARTTAARCHDHLHRPGQQAGGPLDTARPPAFWPMRGCSAAPTACKPIVSGAARRASRCICCPT